MTIRSGMVLIAFLMWTAPAWSAPSCPFPDAQRLSDGIEVRSGSRRLRVTSVRDGVLRVRLAPDGSFPPDASWAVVPEAVQPAKDIAVKDACGVVELVVGGLRARVEKGTLAVAFVDRQGRVILEDAPEFPVTFADNGFTVWKTMPPDELYFGLGDKAGPLGRRDMAFTNWNTDAFKWQESTDPLYKSIPFFLGLRKGRAYGVFLDDPWRSFFDFGRHARGALAFGAEGGPLDYYFFAGPSPKDVVQAYAALTGTAPLPPRWTLGYQQSRWSYPSEARVRELARTFRDKRIPADAIYLDIDYQRGNRPFTVDREKFPRFEGMVTDLAAQGIKIVTIVDLHIKKEPGYAPYDSGLAGDHFIKNPDGSDYVGEVWPGDCVFPDFTRAKTREWFGGLYKDFAAAGVRGFWNDMNEPAVFKRLDKTMPLDVVHRLDDGGTVSHRAAHNVLGMQNVRATYEGLLSLKPDQRPFVLTRAAYSGTQRYAATWTGDNTSSWNHMRMSVAQVLNLGLSGYSNVGVDIGGFIGSPDPELLTRWTELGAFMPLFRNHAIKDSRDREPWVDGPDHEAIRKKYIELRYRLLPYAYAGAEEASRTGLPLVRPVFFEYPERAAMENDGEEFFFGRDLLVAPKLYERVDAYEVELPTATENDGAWYDFWTGLAVEKTKFRVSPALDTVPVYVRPGAVIPMQPVVQSTDEKPSGPLELRVYPGADCGGRVYWDDGETFAYRKGEFLDAEFSCRRQRGSVTVKVASRRGGYAPWWKAVEYRIYGVWPKPSRVTVNGAERRDWTYDHASRSVAVRLEDLRQGDEVRVEYKGKP